MLFNSQDTIVALSTPSGMGAIAVIRVSGKDAFSICDKLFFIKSGKKLSEQKSHSIHFGQVRDEEKVVDEAVAAVFRDPHSFTGEDTVEISCHGSVYIQQQLITLFIRNGTRLATPGEYTMRAFMNGKMDLSQAEAVADLVSSSSEAAHKIAMQQMRGGFSDELKELREQLIYFASMVELELDFSEEDVEFANRKELTELIQNLEFKIQNLTESFKLGNVIKNGIPIAIAGEPNAGKSTLLNVFLNEERAIVSEIPGTTRDTIEDEITMNGIRFRFIDTAGIRETTDKIEALGIGRTFEKIGTSAAVILLFDATLNSAEKLEKEIYSIKEKISNSAHIIPVANKCDLADENELRKKFKTIQNLIFISAKKQIHIDQLKNNLVELVNAELLNSGQTIVSNARHYEALTKALKTLDLVKNGLDQMVSKELLAMDIRNTLFHLGEITGIITSEDLLASIFSRFCIGK